MLGVSPTTPVDAVLYVAPGGVCGGVSPCYDNVPTAVAAAQPGDLLKMAGGVYTGVYNDPAHNTEHFTATQMVILDKSLTIHGGYSLADWDTPDPLANPTILDAQHQGRVLYVLNDAHVTLTGLRLANGNSGGLGGIFYTWNGLTAHVGGGIYATNATLSIDQSEIADNVAPLNPTYGAANLGGGVYASNVQMTLTHSQIRNNRGDCTAGIYLQGADFSQISGNTFDNNQATGGNCYTGGGLTAQGNGTRVEGNTFTDNRSYGGGALATYDDVVVANNIITGNAAIYGGGIHIERGSPTIVGNIITGNTASQSGGGISVFPGGGQPLLLNNIVADNQSTYAGAWHLGGASGILLFDRSAYLAHNTIARNSGPDSASAAIFVVGRAAGGSTVTLHNTILVDHAVGISLTSNITAVIDSILWHNTPITISQEVTPTVIITNQVYGDPAFAPDGYHLTIHSAALDQGVERGFDRDIDGDLRPAGSAPDLGADELPGALAINYPNGAPGSFFTLTGGDFPMNTEVAIFANGTSLGSVMSDGAGLWTAVLDTTNADTGLYQVTAIANRSATVTLTLNTDAPLRPQEGDGPIVTVPPGIAWQEFLFLPIVR